jgi:hypothetical protein
VRYITPCGPLKSTDVSDKYVTYIFRAEEYAGFFLGSLFDPGDGGDIFLRNVC